GARGPPGLAGRRRALVAQRWRPSSRGMLGQPFLEPTSGVRVVAVAPDLEVAFAQVYPCGLFEGRSGVEDDPGAFQRSRPVLQSAEHDSTKPTAPRLGRNEHPLHLGGLLIEQSKGAAGDGSVGVVCDQNDATGGGGSKLLLRRGIEAAEPALQLGEVRPDEPPRVGVVGVDGTQVDLAGRHPSVREARPAVGPQTMSGGRGRYRRGASRKPERESSSRCAPRCSPSSKRRGKGTEWVAARPRRGACWAPLRSPQRSSSIPAVRAEQESRWKTVYPAGGHPRPPRAGASRPPRPAPTPTRGPRR